MTLINIYQHLLRSSVYRLLAQELPGYEHLASTTLYRKFMYNSADIRIEPNQVMVNLKKKRNLPALLSATEDSSHPAIPWMNNSVLIFAGASRS